MAEKINGTHPVEDKVNGDSTHGEESQRLAYIHALQSFRITVLVGPTRTPFQVPKDLLTQHSPIFGEKCRSTGPTGTFELPDVRASTFEDFFIWLHVFEPRMGTKSFEAVLDLAILAETYCIYHLRNQTSDMLWQEFQSKRWELTPDVLSMVYNSVPAGSILRQLCASAFASQPRSSTDDVDHLKWKAVFEAFPELGWDYFVQIQKSPSQPAPVTQEGGCRFHDHSDIPQAEQKDTDHCPYPHGAPASPKEPEPEQKPEPVIEEASLVPTAKPVEVPTPVKVETPKIESVAVPEEEQPQSPTTTSKKNKKKDKKKKAGAVVENGTAAEASSVTSG